MREETRSMALTTRQVGRNSAAVKPAGSAQRTQTNKPHQRTTQAVTEAEQHVMRTGEGRVTQHDVASGGDTEDCHATGEHGIGAQRGRHCVEDDHYHPPQSRQPRCHDRDLRIRSAVSYAAQASDGAERSVVVPALMIRQTAEGRHESTSAAK